jgi:hypothetical protein
MALFANNSTVVGVSGAQNQNHEPAEEGYRPSKWESVITWIGAGDSLAPYL